MSAAWLQGQREHLRWSELNRLQRSGRWEVQLQSGTGHHRIRYGSGPDNVGPFYAYRGSEEILGGWRERVFSDITWGEEQLAFRVRGYRRLAFAPIQAGDSGQAATNDQRIPRELLARLRRELRGRLHPGPQRLRLSRGRQPARSNRDLTRPKRRTAPRPARVRRAALESSARACSLLADCQMVLAMRVAPAPVRWIESYVRPGQSGRALPFASTRSSRRRSSARRRPFTYPGNYRGLPAQLVPGGRRHRARCRLPEGDPDDLAGSRLGAVCAAVSSPRGSNRAARSA